MSDNAAPEGWVQTRVRDLFQCWGGMTPSTAVEAYWGGDTPWISSKDIKSRRVAAGSEFVTARALEETRLRVCRAGTVLVVVRSGVLAHSLPVSIASTSLVVNQDVKALDSTDDELNEWLALYLRAHERDILDSNRKDGTTVQSVRVEELLNRAIPVPPRSEQRRIAEAVELLLAQSDAARDRLAKVPLILKRFRQAVLTAACTGRLTEDLRNDSNYTSHEELGIEFASSWESRSLGASASLITSGSRGWAKYYSDSGPLFVRAQDINQDVLNVTAAAHVRPPRGAEGARTRVVLDDLLVTITGANVTKTARVNIDLAEAYVSQHVGLVRLREPRQSPWVHLWLVSPAHGRRQLLDAAYGAGKPGLSLDNLRAVFVGFPPPKEQNEIIRRVEALFTFAGTIEHRLSAAVARAERLPQAILKKAFSGRLVPNEAELARGQGRNFEPATEFLRRLQNESRPGVKRIRHGRKARG